MNEYEWIAVLLMFMVDFLLLLATNRLWGGPPGGLRCAVASALGAGQTLLLQLPGFGFLSSWLWRVVFLLVMTVVAFGLEKSTILRGGIFGVLQLSVMCIATGEGMWPLILGAVTIFVLCMVPKIGHMQQYVAVTVAYQDRHAEMTALVDTGNTLRDPISGKPVLVADCDVAKRLLSLTPDALVDPVRTLMTSQTAGLRLIPYHGVGVSSGMLLGLKADEVRIGGEKTEHIVAFSPNRLGNLGQYQALAGGVGI